MVWYSIIWLLVNDTWLVSCLSKWKKEDYDQEEMPGAKRCLVPGARRCQAARSRKCEKVPAAHHIPSGPSSISAEHLLLGFNDILWCCPVILCLFDPWTFVSKLEFGFEDISHWRTLSHNWPKPTIYLNEHIKHIGQPLPATHPNVTTMYTAGELVIFLSLFVCLFFKEYFLSLLIQSSIVQTKLR